MAVFDLNRLLSSRRAPSPEEQTACRDLARAWCDLIADAVTMRERLVPASGRERPPLFSEEDSRRA